jgi:histidine triad (HIT) family protein
MAFPVAPDEPCPFCEYLAGTRECAFVVRDELVAAFVNRTQYERGAMLIVPNAHRETILEITDAEIASAHRLAKRLAAAAERAFGAIGANVFQNNGIKAGQHVAHFHVHIVPRYESSNPEKVFQQQDFPLTSPEEQRRIAAAIRQAIQR